MKTLHLLVPFATLAVGSAALAEAPVTQSRDLSGFTHLVLRGSVDVQVREGSSFKVEVTASPDDQKDILTTVSGDTLTIANRSHVFFAGFGHHEEKVTIVMPAFAGIRLSGSGDASIQATGKRDVSLHTSGSGDIHFQGPAKGMEVSTRGSGDITLEGSADALQARTQGSGDIRAKDFPVKSASVQTSGSGDVTLSIQGGPASLATSGSGDINWYGSASQVSQSKSGSGDITHHG